jgi:hypothetical protein
VLAISAVFFSVLDSVSLATAAPQMYKGRFSRTRSKSSLSNCPAKAKPYFRYHIPSNRLEFIMPRKYTTKTSRSQGNKVLNSFIGSLGENSSTSYKLSTGGLLTISNATTSDLPSKISGSTASTGTKSLEVTQTTLSSFQSHPDSVPTAPSLGGLPLRSTLGTWPGEHYGFQTVLPIRS